MKTILHPEVDAVIVGVGWAGSIIASELSRAGVSVVGLERGPQRPLAPDAREPGDELAYVARAALAQNPALETWTLRHDHRERALPLREGASFRPGEGVGGSGVAWGGVCRRWLPHQFRLRSAIEEVRDASSIPADATLQDWPLTYAELEPHYACFERVIGVTGRSGNLGGVLHAGGNPFEGPRSEEYPMPPLEQSESVRLFAEAAERLGLHPYAQPTANASMTYTNPDGLTRSACSYCGRCAFHPCPTGAKASPQLTVLPVAEASGNFELRTHARVFSVEHRDGMARAVRYRDHLGREHVQPAGIVVLSAYTLGNVRLLLLSRVGTPYDPLTGSGTVGRNYTYQGGTTSYGFFADRDFDRYHGANGVAICLDDFSASHVHDDFVGGGSLAARVVGGPLGGVPLPPGTPTWGAGWKRAMQRWSRRSLTVTSSTDVLPYRDHHLDLDPTYRDAWGDPLLRVTYDWKPNEQAITAHLASQTERILREVGATDVAVRARMPAPYDGATYMSTHNNGGAVMGDDPTNSVVSTRLQSWDVENLFVVGASAFPYNSGHGPTGTVGALSYRAAEAILAYHRSPGLVE